MCDLGFVDEAVKEDAYAACDVLCVPSVAESFGRIYVEAWRYGRPVIGIDSPPLRELLLGCEGGLITKPVCSAVAGAALRVLVDRDLADRLGRSGRAKSEQYQPASVAARVEQIYERLLHRRSLPTGPRFSEARM